MGFLSTFAPTRTHCESQSAPQLTGPPKARKIETFEEKAFRKFRQQPLVPIGCIATAYFLVSGIKSFQARDPVRSQRMMKYRVAAQFATLVCFIGYLGFDKLDFRVAPMYQDAKKIKEEESK